MKKKLCKQKNGAMIFGVCNGISLYFNIDVTIVRIAWVLFGCMVGFGIFAYIACALIMPEA